MIKPLDAEKNISVQYPSSPEKSQIQENSDSNKKSPQYPESGHYVYQPDAPSNSKQYQTSKNDFSRGENNGGRDQNFCENLSQDVQVMIENIRNKRREDGQSTIPQNHYILDGYLGLGIGGITDDEDILSSEGMEESQNGDTILKIVDQNECSIQSNEEPSVQQIEIKKSTDEDIEMKVEDASPSLREPQNSQPQSSISSAQSSFTSSLVTSYYSNEDDQRVYDEYKQEQLLKQQNKQKSPSPEKKLQKSKFAPPKIQIIHTISVDGEENKDDLNMLNKTNKSEKQEDAPESDDTDSDVSEPEEIIEEVHNSLKLFDYQLVSVSKMHQLPLDHLEEMGHYDYDLLKTSVLMNFHGEIRLFTKYSLGFIHAENRIRKAIMWIVDWKVFEYFIVIVILMNSVVLGKYDYSDKEDRTRNNQIIEDLNKIFTLIYLTEAFLKVISNGFIFHKTAYMRDAWNVLDFFVVLSGLIEAFSTINTTAFRSLRTIRVIRPMKSINSMPALKKHVNTLFIAIPSFIKVGTFVFLVYIALGIFGLSFYGTSYYNRCRFNPVPESPYKWEIDTSITRPCTKSGWGSFKCPQDRYCGNPYDFNIPLESEGIIDNPQIYYGITVFDNIGTSVLTMHQIISLDNWSSYVYNMMDIDIPIVAVLYGLLVVIFGSYLVMNLILAVIIDTFIKIQQDELSKEMRGTAFDPIIIHVEDRDINLDQLEFRQNEVDKKDQERVEDRKRKKKEKRKQRREQKKIEEQQKKELEEVVKEISETPMNPKTGGLGMILALAKKQQQMRQQSIKLATPMGSGGANTPDNQNPFDDAFDPGSFTPVVKKRNDGGLSQTLAVAPDNSSTNKGGLFGKLLGQNKPNRQHTVKGGLFSILQNQQFMANLTQGEGAKARNQIFNKLLEKTKEKPIGTIQEQKDQHVAMRKLVYMQKLDAENQSSKDAMADVLVRIEKRKIYKFLFHVVQSNYFIFTIMLIILVNTAMLALDGYPKSYLSEEMAQLNIIFTFIFISEMILKLIGLGFIYYIRDPYNFLDCFIVLSSILDMVLSLTQEEQSNANIGTALRGFRVISIFKLAKTWKRFHHLLKTMWRTLVDISTFTVVLFLFMFIFTILAMELFAYKLMFNSNNQVDLEHGTSINQNFDQFVWSFSSVFVLLTADYWSNIWFSLYRAVDGWRATIYVFVIYILGNRILLNLFLAILLQNFDEDSIEQELKKELAAAENKDKDEKSLSEDDSPNTLKKKEESSIQFASAIMKAEQLEKLHSMWSRTKERFMRFVSYRKKRDLYNEEEDGNQPNHVQYGGIARAQIVKDTKGRIQSPGQGGGLNDSIMMDQSIENFNQFEEAGAEGYTPAGVNESSEQVDTPKLNLIDMEQGNNQQISVEKQLEENKQQILKKLPLMRAGTPIQFESYILEGRSLNYFSRKHKFRLCVFRTLINPWFERFMLSSIILTCVQLALCSPLNDPNDKFQKTLDEIDIATTVIFVVECFLKIVAYGLIKNGQNSYLRNIWNIMDCFIMLLSVISSFPSVGNLQVFKMFRIVRILRLISKNEGLQVGISALVRALPNIIRISTIMLLFFLIFGIITVSFFKGTFHYCQNTMASSLPQYSVLPQIHKWDCLNSGGDWQNKYYNFDNIFFAMITLFILCNVSGWQDYMYYAAQVTEIDYNWQRWTREYWVFFFILFMVIGSFFLLNLFVGVVISSFNREKDSIGGNILLTERQKEWIETHTVVLKSKPIKKIMPPDNKYRAFCFHIVDSSKFFKRFITFIVLINTITLTLSWQGQSSESKWTVQIISDGCTFVFLIEAILKIAGYGRLYFTSNWNIMDLVSLLGQISSIILNIRFHIRQEPANGILESVINMLRVCTVLRVVIYARWFKQIFNTLMISIPLLANIGSLLLLVLYIYTIAGMILFGRVKRNYFVKDNLNFESFPKGVFTLLVICTCDWWSDIVASFMKKKSPDFYCLDDPTYYDYVENGYQTIGCGPKYSGVLFFCSYFILMTLIMLKLFIAVILQSYNDIKIKEERLFNSEMLEKFKDTWKEYDPLATGYLDKHHISDFLNNLGDPLDFDRDNMTEEQQLTYIEALGIKVHPYYNKFAFVEVLDKLSLRILIIEHTQKIKRKKSEEEISKAVTMKIQRKMTGKELKEIQERKETQKEKVKNQQSRRKSVYVAEDDKDLNQVRQELLGEISQLVKQENKTEIKAVKDIKSLMGQFFKGQSILITLDNMVKPRPAPKDRVLQKTLKDIANARKSQQDLKIASFQGTPLAKTATVAPRPAYNFDFGKISSNSINSGAMKDFQKPVSQGDPSELNDVSRKSNLGVKLLSSMFGGPSQELGESKKAENDRTRWQEEGPSFVIDENDEVPLRIDKSEMQLEIDSFSSKAMRKGTS